MKRFIINNWYYLLIIIAGIIAITIRIISIINHTYCNLGDTMIIILAFLYIILHRYNDIKRSN